MAVVTHKLRENQGTNSFFQVIITQTHSPSTVQEYACKVRIIFPSHFPSVQISGLHHSIIIILSRDYAKIFLVLIWWFF